MSSIGPAAEVARLLLAAILGVAAAGKLADLRGAERSVRGFGVPPRLAWPVAIVVPLLELALAAGLVVNQTARLAALASAGLFTGFAIAISIAALRGKQMDCGCFGRLQSSPVGPWSAARAIGLAMLATWIGLTPVAPLTAGQALAAAVIIAVLLQAALWFTLLRRYGHALRRIDELENEGWDAGVTVGPVAPEFTLGDLNGARMTLRDLLEPRLPVMLTFVDASCGPCRALLPGLARWQDEASDRLTIAIVGQGSIEQLRAAFDHERVVMVASEDGAVMAEYGVEATPGAVLVAADGTVASPVHYGAESIEALITQVAAPALSADKASAVTSTRPALEVALAR